MTKISKKLNKQGNMEIELG